MNDTLLVLGIMLIVIAIGVAAYAVTGGRKR